MIQHEKLDKLTVYGFKVHHSLSRSDVRRKILVHLRDHSDENKTIICKLTIYTISQQIKTSPDNVKGAIFGDDDNYKIDESLISLGLVAFETNCTRTVYYLTHKGFEVANLL
jgi:predicted transcriptional regulator with HTH domain